MHMSLAVMAHLAEGLCLSALVTVKLEHSLICLQAHEYLFMMEWQLIFLLKTSLKSKALRCLRLE
jgi:hypothetical protein